MSARAEPIDRRRVLIATVTPLASIFGSGFLIIVPVLERALGALSVFGAAGVCAGGSQSHEVNPHGRLPARPARAH